MTRLEIPCLRSRSSASPNCSPVCSEKSVTLRYPIPSGSTLADATLSTLITSRVSVRVIFWRVLGRSRPTVTRVFGLPRSWPTMPSIVTDSSSGRPSMLVIWSPRWIPARSPGVPSIGAMTTARPWRISTRTPIPPNSPLNSSSSSALSEDSRNSECGSSDSAIPCMADRARPS